MAMPALRYASRATASGMGPGSGPGIRILDGFETLNPVMGFQVLATKNLSGPLYSKARRQGH